MQLVFLIIQVILALAIIGTVLLQRTGGDGLGSLSGSGNPMGGGDGGGGGGGGGGGCSFAGSNANSISTNPSESLINNILRKRLGVTINYTTARAVNVPENFYEFYDFVTFILPSPHLLFLNSPKSLQALSLSKTCHPS